MVHFRNRCNCWQLLLLKLILSLQEDLFAVTLNAIISRSSNFWEILVAALLAFLGISRHERIWVFVLYCCRQIVLMAGLTHRILILFYLEVNLRRYLVIFPLLTGRHHRCLGIRRNVGVRHRVSLMVRVEVGLSQLNLFHLLSIRCINDSILLIRMWNVPNISNIRVSIQALFGLLPR